MSWKILFSEIKPPANPRALSDVRPLLKRLDDAFGTRPLARLLGVESTVIADCASGHQKMSPELTRRVMDVHDVLTRAFQVFAPETAMSWLVGNEPFLAGKRPIDVLALGSVAPVIEALDNQEAGAYT
ncbi:MAG TPA: hypothetical protein VFO29_11980 [Candidatus Rubrimentiphilum sp.]|nr:hypothetical protein [Candidatus Rubrimentiphilum sp.]